MENETPEYVDPTACVQGKRTLTVFASVRVSCLQNIKHGVSECMHMQSSRFKQFQVAEIYCESFRKCRNNCEKTNARFNEKNGALYCCDNVCVVARTRLSSNAAI